MSFEIENGVLRKYKEEPDVTEVVIPNDITEIAERAFMYCENIKAVIINGNVKTIGLMAFYRCYKLETVTIAEGVEKIKNEAFGDCFPMKSIIIPASVKEIGDNAFIGCESLESIEVAESNSAYCSIDGVLYDKTVKKLIKCPEAKTEITIPDGVRTISGAAFYNSMIKTITFPESVTRIESSAFSNTRQLETLVIPDTVVELFDFIVSRGSVKTVVLPDDIKSDIIDDYTFDRENYGLETVIIRGTKIDYQLLLRKKVPMKDVVAMINEGNYSIKMDHSFKYGILFDLYLNSYKDKEFEAYFKKNFTKLFKDAIEQDREDVINKVLSDGVLLTKRNINSMIDHAELFQKKNYTELLTNYKDSHLA